MEKKKYTVDTRFGVFTFEITARGYIIRGGMNGNYFVDCMASNLPKEVLEGDESVLRAFVENDYFAQMQSEREDDEDVFVSNRGYRLRYDHESGVFHCCPKSSDASMVFGCQGDECPHWKKTEMYRYALKQADVAPGVCGFAG